MEGEIGGNVRIQGRETGLVEKKANGPQKKHERRMTKG